LKLVAVDRSTSGTGFGMFIWENSGEI